MWRYRGTPFSAAPALQTASDTPRMALAPNWAADKHERLVPGLQGSEVKGQPGLRLHVSLSCSSNFLIAAPRC